MAFLDKTGLERLWAHIILKLNDKVDKTMIDSSLSDTSTNPVQNKVIKSYVDSLVIDDGSID